MPALGVPNILEKRLALPTTTRCVNTFWPRFGQLLELPASPPATHCGVSMYSTRENTNTPFPPVAVTFSPVASINRRFWFPVCVKSSPELYMCPASRQICSTCKARIRFSPTVASPMITVVHSTTLKQNSIIVLPDCRVRQDLHIALQAPQRAGGIPPGEPSMRSNDCAPSDKGAGFRRIGPSGGRL